MRGEDDGSATLYGSYAKQRMQGFPKSAPTMDALLDRAAAIVKR